MKKVNGEFLQLFSSGKRVNENVKVGMDCMIPLSESIELASSMYGA